MKMTTEVDLPFYELFDELRRAGFRLGICDYTLLIEALATDIYSLEPKSIKQLLNTLWVKTRSQKQQFEAIFERTVSSPKLAAAVENSHSSKSVTPELPTAQPKSTSTPGSTPRESKQKYFFFPATAQSAVSTSVDESGDVVKAIKTSQQDLVSFAPTGKSGEYLPVSRQQMVQGWYELRRSIRMGTRRELDVDATIEQTKRQGKLVVPVMKPRRLKYSSLLLLIDQRGSMQPFQVLSRLLVATAEQTGCLNSQSCYYFHNYPQDELYGDSQFNSEIPVAEVLSGLSSQHTVVLIFSDAGAARGDYTQRRIDQTGLFLERLKPEVKTIVWLNPVPESAWLETTAEHIAKFQNIQMLSADSQGFETAIEVLQ